MPKTKITEVRVLPETKGVTYRIVTNEGPMRSKFPSGIQQITDSDLSLSLVLNSVIGQIHPTVLIRLEPGKSYPDDMVFVFPSYTKEGVDIGLAKGLIDRDYRAPIAVYASKAALNQLIERFNVSGWNITPLGHKSNVQALEDHMRHFYLERASKQAAVGKELDDDLFDDDEDDESYEINQEINARAEGKREQDEEYEDLMSHTIYHGPDDDEDDLLASIISKVKSRNAKAKKSLLHELRLR